MGMTAGGREASENPRREINPSGGQRYRLPQTFLRRSERPLSLTVQWLCGRISSGIPLCSSPFRASQASVDRIPRSI
jgi:hypothetical protein